MGLAGLQSSRDEFLSAVAVSNSHRAFYAAEAGIHSAVSNWDQRAMDTLVANPGDTLIGSWTTIENRCSYRLVYRRIDGGDTDTPLYSVESTGQSPGLNGGRRRIGMIVKGPLLFSQAGVAFDKGFELSGNLTVVGACGSIHSNGDLLVSGGPTVSGNITTAGVATGNGNPVDELRNPVTPTGGAPSQRIPDLVSTDYCGEAEFIFSSSGQGFRVSTSESFDFSAQNAVKWGWEWNSEKNIYMTKESTLGDGVYCIDGNVQFPNDVGSPRQSPKASRSSRRGRCRSAGIRTCNRPTPTAS